MQVVTASPLRNQAWLQTRFVRKRLESKHLSKPSPRVPSDNADWSDEQIVEGYRGQHHVERAFRDLKDPAIVQFNPLFHWTDSKIRVHACSCILALTLVGLLHRQVVQAGVDISRARLLEELKQVRVVTNLYSPAIGSKRGSAGRPRAETVLSQRTPLQKKLCEILQLDPFLLR